MIANMFHRAALFLGAAATAAMFSGSVRAEYPEKYIRIIVPFLPGGTADGLGRVYADAMTARLGQNVIIENRPGAGGNVGAEAAAKSPADGYTLFFASPGTHAINPTLYKSLPFDPVKDFTPISLVLIVPNILVVHPSRPFNTVGELIDYAKRNPGKLNFGSSGNGTTVHLTGELFKSLTGADLTHVPYRGAGPAMADLLGGQIDMIFDTLPTSLGYIRSGQLRGLAIATKERVPQIPELPTFEEAGVPGVVSGAWYGFLGPANLPSDVVRKLNKLFTELSDDPAFSAKLREMGATPLKSTPEEFGGFIRSEIARWSDVVRRSGATVN